MPPPTGPGLVAYPALPTANAEPTGALVPKMKLQDLKDARPYVFNMVIVAIRTASTNYDPEHAISNFNAALQDALGTKSGIEDIPTNMYMVQFQKPDATGGSTNYGKFVCQVPGPMEPLVLDLTKPDGDQSLKFTGDGAGNSYQLEWEAFVTPENKKKRREANDKQWCFVIPQTKGNITMVPERQVYERAIFAVVRAAPRRPPALLRLFPLSLILRWGRALLATTRPGSRGDRILADVVILRVQHSCVFVVIILAIIPVSNVVVRAGDARAVPRGALRSYLPIIAVPEEHVPDERPNVSDHAHHGRAPARAPNPSLNRARQP